jgi:hypothetical protein
MTPAMALRSHAGSLTEFEQSEILEFPQVWYLGAGASKHRASPEAGSNNHGYDDDRGDYRVVTHDHLAYRYEVLGMLGRGSFGQVAKCYDYRKGCLCAIKVIRNKTRFHAQALIEVKILERLRGKDGEDDANVVHMREAFYFRGHLCISFELLSINLYDFIKNNNFAGLSAGLIRRIAAQLLVGLKFLRKQRIIHCDLVCSHAMCLEGLGRLKLHPWLALTLSVLVSLSAPRPPVITLRNPRTFCCDTRRAAASRSSTSARAATRMSGCTRTSRAASTGRRRSFLG